MAYNFMAYNIQEATHILRHGLNPLHFINLVCKEKVILNINESAHNGCIAYSSDACRPCHDVFQRAGYPGYGKERDKQYISPMYRCRHCSFEFDLDYVTECPLCDLEWDGSLFFGRSLYL